MLIFNYESVVTDTFKKVEESESEFFFWSLVELFPDDSWNESWMLSFVHSSCATDTHMILLNSSAPFNMQTFTVG